MSETSYNIEKMLAHAAEYLRLDAPLHKRDAALRMLDSATSCEDAAKLIATLVNALETVINDDWRMSCAWGPSDERQLIMDKARAALALARKELP